MRNLYIKQKVFKITDHYPVMDELQNPVYYVDQNFKLLGLSVIISCSTGEKLCHIDKKIISLLPTFFLYFYNGVDLMMRSRFSLFRQKIDILPESLGIYIEGNYLDHNFSVYKNQRLIGRINKKFLSWGDTYHLEVLEEEYELLFVAIVIAIDHIKDAQNSASSNNS